MTEIILEIIGDFKKELLERIIGSSKNIIDWSLPIRPHKFNYMFLVAVRVINFDQLYL